MYTVTNNIIGQLRRHHSSELLWLYKSKFLNTVLIQVAAFWDFMPISLVADYQCCKETCCLHLLLPVDGSNKFIQHKQLAKDKYSSDLPP